MRILKLDDPKPMKDIPRTGIHFVSIDPFSGIAHSAGLDVIVADMDSGLYYQLQPMSNGRTSDFVNWSDTCSTLTENSNETTLPR